jgi:8-oxoguanine deaminase
VTALWIKDPVAVLVVRGAHRADRVMVAGNWVLTDAAIPGLDMAGLVRRHTAAANALHAG